MPDSASQSYSTCEHNPPVPAVVLPVLIHRNYFETDSFGNQNLSLRLLVATVPSVWSLYTSALGS